MSGADRQELSELSTPSVMDDDIYTSDDPHEQLKILVKRNLYFREQIALFERQKAENTESIKELLRGA